MTLTDYRALIEQIEDLVLQYIDDQHTARIVAGAAGAALQEEGEVGEGGEDG